MSIFKEFKDFAMKGNVIDMAVGVVIGGAFGKIVTSLVNDIIMPPIGILIGGVNFKDLSLTLKEAQGDVAAVTLNYGAFIQTVFDFTIVALAIFIFIKALNTAKAKFEKEEETAAPAPAGPTDVELLTEIRDLLQKKA